MRPRPREKTSIRSSPLGPLALFYREGALCRLRLPPRPPRHYRGEIPGPDRDWAGILSLEVPADFAGLGTDFQRRIWAAAAAIPPGATRSYAGIARAAGFPSAARAAGTALKANPLPLLVPCHRIIRADGRRGGFSAGEGWKRFLLDLEGRRGAEEA